VSKHEADISLIKKYLNGELDARAMHHLEARAQDDPFLMDAIEGYENTGHNQQSNLADLDSRLQQRVGRKQRRIIPVRTLAIAASVLIAFTIGWLWLSNSPKQLTKPLARSETPPVKPSDAPPAAHDTGSTRQLATNIPAATAPKHIITVKQAHKAAPSVADELFAPDKSIALKEVKINNDTPVDKDTTPLNEMVVMDYTSKKAAAPIDTVSAGYLATSKNKPSATTDQVLKSHADGVGKTPALSPFSSPQQQAVILPGRVINNKDRLLLPDAPVRAKGTSYGAATDKNSRLLLGADSIKSKTEPGVLGYNTAKTDTRAVDSSNTIALEPGDNSLSEVVVVNSNQTMLNARPENGWVNFNKYIAENALSPDGVKGKVKLSFMVAADGSVNDIKVTSHVSPGTDQKAIELISKGPKWRVAGNGKPQLVNLQVRFER
jgi:hypothetical protein